MNAFDLKGKQYPLMYGESISKCTNKSLIKGKIVVCSYVVGSELAVGFVFRGTIEFASVTPRLISTLSLDDFGSLVSYVNSTK